MDINIKKETRQRIGQMLVSRKLITPEQLEDAIKTQKNTGKRLGEVLVRKGYLSVEDFNDVLTIQKGFDSIDLSTETERIDQGSALIIPKEFALKNSVFAFNQEEDILYVALQDPLNISIIDDIRLITGFEVKPFMSSKTDIDNAIRKYMSEDYNLKEIEEIIKDKDFIVQEKFEDRGKVEENPLVKLANQILLKAVSLRASDVHIEPHEKQCTIRYRIDGVLQNIRDVPKSVQRLLISRYKIMGGMDITESRLPQDGRSSVKFHNRVIDLRVASIPTVFGENITIRILDRGGMDFDVTKVGLDGRDLELYLRKIEQPYGSVIITGPTGSGKTTTLYASLMHITSSEKKIYTIEDPVEYRFPEIMQVQVNSKIGMDFARGLRSLLRSDPDIVMVGEVRDLETAKIALESAITGHLVLTTLHTNDAPSSLTRLMEMGAESYMISSAVSCIVAQRLVRVLCKSCKEEYIIPDDVPFSEEIRKTLASKKAYKAVGCPRCSNTGYFGRIGIFSVMAVSKKIKNMLLRKESTDDIDSVAREEGMKTLVESAAEKVLQGITSIEEMYRVVY